MLYRLTVFMLAIVVWLAVYYMLVGRLPAVLSFLTDEPSITHSLTHSSSDAAPTDEHAYYHEEIVFEGKTAKVMGVRRQVNGSQESYNNLLKIRLGDSAFEAQLADEYSRAEKSWLTDLDHDGNLEIAVTVRSEGSGGYATLLLFEITGGSVHEYRVPEALPQEVQQVYMGHDLFEIEPGSAGQEGFIERKFPLYLPGEPNCCPSGGTGIRRYAFRDKRIVALP
jgi:hypothetical protein